MARPNLRKTAAQQAHAEYDPQIRGVRRDIRNQVQSVQSAGPALEASLNLSGQQLRHSGLSPRDLTIALSELAHRTADVGASTALQTQQVRQQGHGELVDLLQGRAQAQRSALSQLQAAQAEHAQDLQDEIGAEIRGFKMDILKEEALKRLGLGSYADNGASSAADTESHHNAAFYAKQYFSASKGGITDPKTGEVIIPANPQHWDDSTWNALVEKVAGQKGVDNVEAAQKAVQAIRDHVQPGSDATAGSLLHALGTAAAAAAPVLAPPALAPVAQFGSRLLAGR